MSGYITRRLGRWGRCLDWFATTRPAYALVAMIRPIQVRQTKRLICVGFGVSEGEARQILGINDAAAKSRRD